MGVQNSVEIDSAVMSMRMREKRVFVWISVNIWRSVAGKVTASLALLSLPCVTDFSGLAMQLHAEGL